MEEVLITQATEYGIWALLFVSLFMYVLYDSSKREEKYRMTINRNQDIINDNQEIIKDLSISLKIVSNIERDVCDIQKSLKKNG